MVEYRLAKARVAGSNPVSRSIKNVVFMRVSGLSEARFFVLMLHFLTACLTVFHFLEKSCFRVSASLAYAG